MVTGGRAKLLTRGLRLEYATLGWNVAGVAIVPFAAFTSRSVALAGFGLDSMIEIASVVVVWELTGAATHDRQRAALRLIGTGLFALAFGIGSQTAYVLIAGAHPRSTALGLAAGKPPPARPSTILSYEPRTRDAYRRLPGRSSPHRPRPQRRRRLAVG